MGDPSGDEFHGSGQGFQRLVGEVIPLEAAEEGFDQAIGLGTAARGVTVDQAKSRQQLLELIQDELRPVVGEELAAFGVKWLSGKTFEQGFAEEFADIQSSQTRL